MFLLTDVQAQHPLTFFTKAEAANVKKELDRYPLLLKSYKDIKIQVDKQLGTDIDVPVPKDPAGGYTHDRHKSNYMLMFNSGILYNLTGDLRYAVLVKRILLKYALLNPTLKKHPQATSSSPGHIFWQALNDANWLVYTGMAYDLVQNSLSPAERKTIEDGAFKPEVDFITKDLNSWFNLIHNHGVWACAGVGIVGIATDNKEYVDIALYGTAKDGKSGFVAQLDGLFSPDGYYTEGPYYARYAILPYYIFANALQHARPSLKIFEHRGRILLKALQAALQQTNTDGSFFPFNDAIKEKDYSTSEMITAVNIAWTQYGADPGLLAIAKNQKQVMLNGGGASIAAALTGKNVPSYYPYKSVEYADGVKGDEGGIALIRSGKEKKLTTLLFKYTAHGLSHGHFDKLNISLYDQGNEILSDYGSARFVGVEQKYGGRYLPENDKYAAQTIAHNTVVADETSHFNGSEKQAEKFHANKQFSHLGNPAVQVVSADADNAYRDVRLQRTVYMLGLPGEKKLMLDVFHTYSNKVHQYDLPFQYKGQLISTSFRYRADQNNLQPLGSRNGYEYLWKEAQASIADTVAQFTFLNGQTYYTISTLVSDSATLFFTRTGANDPEFNLRREPAFIVRQNGQNKTFMSLLEIHGKMDPVIEISSQSYPSVTRLKLIRDDADFTVVQAAYGGKELLIAQSNKDFKDTEHTISNQGTDLTWKGPYAVWYDHKRIGVEK
ncbi:heparinase II/III family protein [Terrimonas sp. NA20]|uniref:Heparinase II/III family protein n=1 Tax=Terrimonas ginsenosidimutans TaxID=2908004 RepID=A0ABS9L028_9BACT|nr:heparinase II/III family protein [Terrimonas ginsenosidimutans]MCG2617977.1 heparinase II/III family protein [Terrimonas ginsenosidimutans]